MKREGDLKWSADRSLAANTPMLLRAGLVEGRLDARRTVERAGRSGVIDDLPTVAELIARDHDRSRSHAEAPGRTVVKDPRLRLPKAGSPWTRPRRNSSAPAARSRAATSGRPAIATSGNPAQPGEEREEALLSRRGRLWSWTTNHYAPPEPYVAPDPFVPYTVCAVELDAEQMVVLGGLATGADPDAARGRHGDGAGARAALRGRRARVRRVAVGARDHEGNRSMSGERDIAILGVGMHPWGKWGRNFVEYGVVAAQAALADAGVEWHDIQFVSGGETVRNGYPGYVAGATFAQALGWNGAQVASSYAACASGVTALSTARAQILAGFVRRRAGHRRRHDAEGIPRAEQGRARRRSRLAALPAARRDQPDLLRAVRPPPHGAVRRDARGLRAGEGEERASTGSTTRTRATARKSAIDDVLNAPLVSDPLGLLDICATSDGAAALVVVQHRLRAPPRRDRSGARRRDLDGHARATRRPRSSCPNFATDSAAGAGAMPAHGFKESIAARAYEEAGLGPDDLDCAEVYDLSTAMELDWYEQIGLCAPGEAEKLLRDGATTIGGRIPVNASGGLACFGEAVPAQAIAQVCELTWQLQGQAERPPGRRRHASACRSTKASSATAPRSSSPANPNRETGVGCGEFARRRSVSGVRRRPSARRARRCGRRPWRPSRCRTAAAGRTRCRAGSPARPRRRRSCAARRERHVDPRRHAGRGDDLALLDDALRRRGRAEVARAASSDAQCVVAFLPSSSPAAPSSSEPVHTDVVHVLLASIARIHSSVGSSSIERAGADAAGHDEDVGARDLVDRVVGDERRACPVSVRTGPRSARDELHLRVGQALQHLVGADRVERGEPVEDEQGDVHRVLLVAVARPARDGRKRSRYSIGLAPTRRANARRRVSAVPKPAARATSATRQAGRLEQPARDLDADASRRTPRACCRPRRGTRGRSGGGSSRPRAASRSTLRSSSGCSAIQLCRSRSGSRSATCDAELRAELRLAARALHEQHELARGHQRDVAAEVVVDEREREVHARGHARRRPHVAVAHEDRIGLDGRPSGCRRARTSHARQCVVARRPSSSPAAASTNAPVHTDATRRLRRGGALRPTRRARRPGPRRIAPSPPTTTSVSIGPRTRRQRRGRRRSSARDVVRAARLGAATSTGRRRLAPVRRATSAAARTPRAARPGRAR